MFTVKYTKPDGYEEVFSATRVQVYREKLDDVDPGVVIDMPKGSDAQRVHYGFSSQPGREGPVIYVMNEHGATVAKYHL